MPPNASVSDADIKTLVAWMLLAGLFLALTPISVATNRNNTIDSLLVLTHGFRIVNRSAGQPA